MDMGGDGYEHERAWDEHERVWDERLCSCSWQGGDVRHSTGEDERSCSWIARRTSRALVGERVSTGDVGVGSTTRKIMTSARHLFIGNTSTRVGRGHNCGRVLALVDSCRTSGTRAQWDRSRKGGEHE